MTVFREARREDVPAIIALLADDPLGQNRESTDMPAYLAAFDDIAREGGNLVIVGEDGGEVVATYQITFISGLSLNAARRAQIESVRVLTSRRGQGIGAALLADAEAQARRAGCVLIQLTSNASRTRARAFYERHGFTASHVGFKRYLD